MNLATPLRLSPFREILILLAFFAPVLCASSPAMGAEQNLFPDAAFESDADVPGAWQPQVAARPWERRAFSIHTEGGRAFARATQRAAMVVERPVDPAWKSVRLSFEVRLQGIEKGKELWDAPFAQLDFLDASGKSLLDWKKTIFMTEDTDWKTVTRDSSVPEGAEKLVAGIGFKAKAGTADFANIQVTVPEARSAAELEAIQREEDAAAQKAAEERLATLANLREWDAKRRAAESRPIGDWVRPLVRPVLMDKPLDPPPVTGETYYVATDGNDDAGDGSKDKPWKTIQHGMNQLHPGDRLYIRGGEYRENTLTLARSGRADAYITIAGFPGETARIICDGGNAIFNFAAGSSWMPKRLHEEAYIVVRDLHLDANGRNQAVSIMGPMLLPGFKNDFIASRPFRHNIWVVNNDITGGNGKQSIVGAGYGAHHIVISNNRIHDSLGGVNSYLYSDGTIIEFNEVFNTSADSDDAGAIKSMAPGVIIRYNKVYKNNRSETSKKPGWAPASRGGAQWKSLQGVSGIYIDWAMTSEKNNNYPEEFIPEDPANYVYGNIVHNNNGGFHAFRSDNAVIFNNLFFDNGRDTTGSYVEGDPSKKFLPFHGPAGSGMLVQYCDNVRVYGNIIFNNPKNGFSTTRAPGLVVADNILFGNEGPQINVRKDDIPLLISNTVLKTEGQGPAIDRNGQSFDSAEAYSEAFRSVAPAFEVVNVPAGMEPRAYAERLFAEGSKTLADWQESIEPLAKEHEVLMARIATARAETVPQAPYDPSGGLQEPLAWALPGKVEFEDYDVGGEDVSYHDKDSINEGGHYRADGVDVKASPAGSNGAVVGHVENGEWLEYTVDVAEAGNYRFTITYAADAQRTLSITRNGQPLGEPVTLPSSGGWNSLSTVEHGPVSLEKGEAVLRFTADNAPIDLDRFVVTPAP